MPSLDISWKTFRPAEGFYTSEVAAPRPWPIRTFLPAGYEPRYPYPLIVFFHGNGDILAWRVPRFLLGMAPPRPAIRVEPVRQGAT